MGYEHRIKVHVEDRDEPVVTNRFRRISGRILAFLFGKPTDVLVISPGKTVRSVEIYETKRSEDDGSTQMHDQQGSR